MLLFGLFSLVGYAQNNELNKLDKINTKEHQSVDYTISKLSDVALANYLPNETFAKSVEIETIARIGNDCGCTQTVEPATQQTEETPCPNRKMLKNLCMMISGRTKNHDPATSEKYPFMYQKRLLEAGCVDLLKDSEEVIYEKIRKAWLMYESDLKCNSTTFDLRDGHLLKYAINETFEDFIDDVCKWKVNFNKVDESDGRTTLDYLKYHIDRMKGTALETKYDYYYRKFRNAGAKHKSEL